MSAQQGRLFVLSNLLLAVAGPLLCLPPASDAAAFTADSTASALSRGTFGRNQRQCPTHQHQPRSSPFLEDSPFFPRGMGGHVLVLGAVKLEGQTIQGEVVPLNNFVLVKLAAAQEQTDGGILLTGKAKIVKTQGRVEAVGPGRTHPDSGRTLPVPLVAGEGVLYGKYDGTEIVYNDERHMLIRDDDVLVKFANGDGGLTIGNVEVIRDNVLVKVDTSEKTTEGGILIAKTSSADKRPSTGEVIKVGPGRTASNGDLMPMEVSIGDVIKFRDFAGNEVEIDGQEYCVVKMVDVLAKF
jgi:chaperonin GroES